MGRTSEVCDSLAESSLYLTPAPGGGRRIPGSGTSLSTHLYLGSGLLPWVCLTLYLQPHSPVASLGP